MKRIKGIVNSFNNEIDLLEREVEEVLSKAETGIKIAKKTLGQLRSLTLNKNFKCNDDEIFFFKHLKPKVYSRLIYYIKLFNIESKRPRGSSKSQKKLVLFLKVEL